MNSTNNPTDPACPAKPDEDDSTERRSMRLSLNGRRCLLLADASRYTGRNLDGRDQLRVDLRELDLGQLCDLPARRVGAGSALQEGRRSDDSRSG